MTKITLTNDFHNSEITLSLKDGKTISASQAKKAWNTLCGIKVCTCSNSLGMRGYNNPKITEYQDGSATIITD